MDLGLVSTLIDHVGHETLPVAMSVVIVVPRVIRDGRGHFVEQVPRGGEIGHTDGSRVLFFGHRRVDGRGAAFRLRDAESAMSDDVDNRDPPAKAGAWPGR